MKRRELLALLGGVVGGTLAGCTELIEDDQTGSAAPTANVPTVENSTVPERENVTFENYTVENFTAENVTIEPPDVENFTAENVTIEPPDVENFTAEAPTVEFTITDVDLCPDPPDEIEVVNHSLAPGPNETYYVEGTVRNEGPDTACSYVALKIKYPDDRHETDSLFMGELDPKDTSYFILGPINLSGVDPDSVGYEIYVTNESWDDE